MGDTKAAIAAIDQLRHVGVVQVGMGRCSLMRIQKRIEKAQDGNCSGRKFVER
jgi:hypothetical protein